MTRSSLLLLTAALLAACGSPNAAAPTTSLAGHWTLRSVDGRAVPTLAPIWAAQGYLYGNAMLQSGYMDITTTGYHMGQAMSAPNDDAGTVDGVAASLIFHGKYGDLTGSVRGDTLHERFFQTDYAYTR
jgi:hypothetical protein